MRLAAKRQTQKGPLASSPLNTADENNDDYELNEKTLWNNVEAEESRGIIMSSLGFDHSSSTSSYGWDVVSDNDQGLISPEDELCELPTIKKTFKAPSQVDSDNCQKSSSSYSQRLFLEDWSNNNSNKFSTSKVKKLMMTLSAADVRRWDSLMRWTVVTLLLSSIMPVSQAEGLVPNSWERPLGMPKITHLEVMCGNQHMEVHLAFDKPFYGLVASKGMYGQQDCIYVRPRSGQNEFVFNIYYEKCGTKPDNHGKFYENTIVVQYDEELIEAWDEAKRLRCEWFNDYEKTATKTSPMVISDLEVVELNFHGDNVDCWMEIQEGKGPWAPPLSGIAPLGSTLTMVIAVKDPSGEFDMRVKDCDASDGKSGRNLPLSDTEGCIVRPKLLGRFSKVKLDDGRATVLTYAFISAFKFPDMLNVHLRCTVEICRHGCPDHCLPQGGGLAGQYSNSEPVAAQSQTTFTKVVSNQLDGSDNRQPIENLTNGSQLGSLQNHNLGSERPQTVQPVQEVPTYPVPSTQHRPPPPPNPLHSGEAFASDAPPQMRPPPPLPQYGGRPQRAPRPPNFPPGLLRPRFPGPLGSPPRFQNSMKHLHPPSKFHEEQQRLNSQRVQNLLLQPEPKSRNSEKVVDRSGEALEDQRQNGKPEEPASDSEESLETEMLMQPQALKDETGQTTSKTNDDKSNQPSSSTVSSFPKGPRNLRFRRSVTGSSDIVGVQGAFRVVSQADLNFALNSSASGATPTIVLKGKMIPAGDPIYGICLPKAGFGFVFFGLGFSTLVAILIAGFLAYAHYTMLQYKGAVQAQAQCSEGVSPQSMPSVPVPVYNQFFPMVILRKIW